MSGSLTLAIYTLAFVQKLVFALCTICCPVTVVSFKKWKRDMPRDFSHYANEFDFEIDDEAYPVCYPEVNSQISTISTHIAKTDTKIILTENNCVSDLEASCS